MASRSSTRDRPVLASWPVTGRTRWRWPRSPPARSAGRVPSPCTRPPPRSSPAASSSSPTRSRPGRLRVGSRRTALTSCTPRARRCSPSSWRPARRLPGLPTPPSWPGHRTASACCTPPPAASSPPTPRDSRCSRWAPSPTWSAPAGRSPPWPYSTASDPSGPPAPTDRGRSSSPPATSGARCWRRAARTLPSCAAAACGRARSRRWPARRAPASTEGPPWSPSS